MQHWINRSGFWWVLGAVLCYFLVFHRLDALAVNSWDESLFASRAFELAYHGELFTNWQQIDHCTTDYPNTKPPLVTSFQALFFKILGYNRLALRLPIAIMGLLTALLLYRWHSRWFSRGETGFLAALMLLSAWGFNHYHILRTGDHDAALTYWFMLSIFSAWAYRFAQRSNLYLLLVFFFTGCAILTKSVLGVLMVPGIAIYLLFFTSINKLFKNLYLYIGVLLLLAMVTSFYGMMEIRESGFLRLVWDNEIGGRYVKAIESHQGPWYYYLEYLFSYGYSWFLIWVFPGIWFGLRAKNRGYQHATLLVLLCLVIALITLSISSTKLEWYGASLYPLLAFLSAGGLVGVVEHWVLPILGKQFQQSILKPIVFIIICGAATAYPIYSVIEKNASEETTYDIERYELALEKLRKSLPEYKRIRLHTRGEYNPNLVFLQNRFEKIYGYDIETVTSSQELKPGDLVFGSYHDRFKYYSTTTLFKDEQIYLWRINYDKR